MNVLVVDDEMDCRELVQTIIERAGARVTACASVVEALAAIDANVPDVIVSDIAMPDHDGLSFVKKVRARSAAMGGSVPAIALTAYTREEDRRAAIAAGFTVHLSKPVEPRHLVDTIARVALSAPMVASLSL